MTKLLDPQSPEAIAFGRAGAERLVRTIMGDTAFKEPETDHFERTDVVWKPLRQVKAWDTIYSPGAGVSKLRVVMDVCRNEAADVPAFRTRLMLEGGGVFEGWDSSAIAYPTTGSRGDK